MGQIMIEKTVEIATQDGSCTTFITHPDRGGPHPLVILYMDAPGIREELRDIARRLATSGYYVMLPNMYYRASVMELGPLDMDPASPSRKRMFDLMGSLTIPLVMADTDAWLAYADADPAARGGKIGTFGYCMSGRYAISAAARHPGRVAAAASIYGVQLVTDAPDSPHMTARQARAEIYVACAETDSYAPPEMIAALEASFKADGVNGEIEWYPGTHHGFAFPQRAVYDKAAGERHWARLHALFGRNL